MQNQNYNRQGSNYYQPQQPNYPQQNSGQPPYERNQMSNYQPPPGQQLPYGQQNSQYGPPSQYGQPPLNQMSQPPYGQPSYGPPPQNGPSYGQQPYGPPQNQSPYGNQPQYGPPQGSMPPQNNMPPQQFSQGGDPNQTDIPSFKLIGRGKGIDEREYYVITHAASNALNAKEDPLSNGIIKKIKADIGGEWMVFASVEGLKGYDFSLSIVTGNDFLSFTIQNFRFQVCRLRD